MQTTMTLCIIRDGDRVLLAEKKRGFGAGFWNGYGGKLEIGESIEEALVREVREESGLELLEYEKRGMMEFRLADGAIKVVHIYEGTKWEGNPVETEEMRPDWFEISLIPMEKMWASDPLWYPYFLKREYFEGRVDFNVKREVIHSSFI
jgi:8-oxo-dGTP pyrophosphatase MutT (NUDIX family)